MEANCKVILTSQVNKEEVAKLMVFLKENLPNVRNFVGCNHVEILFNETTHKMIFNETWKSKEHHEKYIEFITNNGIMDMLATFLLGMPDVQYYTVQNI